MRQIAKKHFTSRPKPDILLAKAKSPGMVMAMDGKLTDIMANFLISDSELSAEARLSVKTIKSLKAGSNKPRVQTKRACLDGLNRILKMNRKKTVGVEVFS